MRGWSEAGMPLGALKSSRFGVKLPGIPDVHFGRRDSNVTCDAHIQGRFTGHGGRGTTGIVAEMAAELYSAKLAAPTVEDQLRAAVEELDAAARMPKLQSAAPVVEAVKQDEEPRLYLFSADYPTLQKKNGRPIIGGTFKTTKSGNRFIVRAIEKHGDKTKVVCRKIDADAS